MWLGFIPFLGFKKKKRLKHVLYFLPKKRKKNTRREHEYLSRKFIASVNLVNEYYRSTFGM
jgi:hypothetical protein